jgi:hypothetical protein
MTQTLPRSLHSTQTEWVGVSGLRPASSAETTSSSCGDLDRAAPQLEVDRDVLGDRRGLRQGVHVLRVGVDQRAVGLDVGQVAQRLDPPGGRARSDRDQRGGDLPDVMDPLDVGGVVIDPSTSDTS